MNKYKLEINAKNALEAKAKIIEMCKNNELEERHLDEIEEPINWYNQAKETAKDILEEHKETIDKIISDGDKTDDEDDIFDTIYQNNNIDLYNICHEWIDGHFIYNNIESIKKALDCINKLYEYEETDNRQWDGLKTVEEKINAQAFFTLRNAVYTFLEEELREYIDSKLNNE